MKVLLQVPDGLKRKVLELAEALEKQGKKVFISCESCYGGCDLRDAEAKRLGCDKIVHYGHNKIIKSKMAVEYEELRAEIDIVSILEKNFEKIEKYNSFGLVTSLQFLDSLPAVKKFLEAKNKKVFIGKSRKLYAGQILGCDLSAALAVEQKVDCFLFVGSGKFHALGVALKTEKPVFTANIEKNTIERVEKESFLKQRLIAVALAKQANSFGILISTKPGQLRIKEAESLKRRLEKKGKKAYLLVFDEIKPEKLLGIEVDAYINTACPRIAIEDRALYEKPLLNSDEAEEILGNF